MTAEHQSADQILTEARALWAQGQQDAAYDLCSAFLKKRTDNSGPLLHYFAGILESRGNIFGALKHLEFACKTPNAPTLYFLDLAKLMTAHNMGMESQNVLNIAMKRDPGNQEVKVLLAAALIKNGFFEQGAKLFEFVLKQNPDDWQIWHTYAAAVSKTVRLKKAEALFEQTLQCVETAKQSAGNIDPPTPFQMAQILMGKADLMKTLGKTDICETTLRQILTISNSLAIAWNQLATLRKFTDADFATVEGLLNDPTTTLPSKDLQYLHYALGEAYMRRGDSEVAIKHFIEANQYQRNNLNYNEENTLGFMRNLPRFYTPKTISHHALSADEDREQQFIFIVGIPRSGSSLLERILDSHSDVFGLGEIDTLQRIEKRVFGNAFPTLPQHANALKDKRYIAALADAYRQEVLRALPPEALSPEGKRPKYLVDKLLGNFVSAGLIAMAFPNSKIIYARRNPLDTCFSCFTHYFGDGHDYLCDQTEIGRFYLAVQDLMSYWQDTLSTDQFLTVDYEKVIDDAAGETKRILDFLGLEWQEDCLNFHSSKREVRTHSALEVRKPIYSSSVGRWLPYKAHLSPLFDALGIDPDQAERDLTS
ncbi:sulfotransferase [Thalassospira sp. MA62]|nr:sulfotransferase [Thalassospira sp. MA62]